MLVDAHCHLTDLSPDALEATLDRARETGVSLFVAIGAGFGIEDAAKTLAMSEARDDMVCALAVHPHDARLVTEDNFKALAQLIRTRPKVRAVGEIGLDYHYMNSDKEAQRDVFRRFIGLAKEAAKPVVIHDRECGEECPDILAEEGGRDTGGMVHCFSGDLALAKRYLDLGFYVSFTGIITFKKSEALREVVAYVPLDRMLVETDTPFLAPVPFRGKKNEPAFVKHVAACVAEVKNIPFETVAATTTQNARRLFNIT